MKKIKINTEYITLGQFLKYIAVIPSGAYAKSFLQEEVVYVNGETEARRGRKLYPGHKISFNKEVYLIEASDD